MKILDAIWGKAAYIAIVLGALIFLGSIITTRDVPKAFAMDYKKVNQTIAPEELASLYIENRRDFEVLDLRQLDSYNRGHIKNAISCPACHDDKNDAKEKQKEMPDFNKKFIVYTQTGKETIRLPRALATHKNIFLLSGGYESWENQILQPLTVNEDDSDEEIYRKKRQNAIYKYFTGKEQVPATPASEGKTIKKKSSHSLGKSEGC